MNNNQQDKFSRKKLKSSYTTVVVSLSLLFFLIGVFGLSLIKMNRLLDYIKENFAITIELEDKANNLDVILLEKELKYREEVKSVEYIEKEVAVNILTKEIGIDFMKFLDSNPLFDSYDIKLKANYVSKKNILELRQFLEKKKIVKEVLYDNLFIEKISKNIKMITYWFIGVNVFFLLICIVLMKNAIKLALYSDRFTIKTMQLVGASQKFISRPYIKKNIIYGVMSSFLTITGIYFLAYFFKNKFSEVFEGDDYYTSITILSVSLVLFSIIITTITTFISVRRFLRKKVEDLYS